MGNPQWKRRDTLIIRPYAIVSDADSLHWLDANNEDKVTRRLALSCGLRASSREVLAVRRESHEKYGAMLLHIDLKV